VKIYLIYAKKIQFSLKSDILREDLLNICQENSVLFEVGNVK
jgi:hypothetical protein